MFKPRAVSSVPNNISHEELFIQRYERLFAWSLKLTDNHQEQAEDLVHDAFIQFTLNRPELDSIENIDGYLRATLRNVHLSQVRRASQSPNANLSIADYDSAEIGLRATDPTDRIRVQEELRLICHYACVRKQTAKTGSVLILRFFHGYYPSEIARVLGNTTQAVKVWLHSARGESKLYLADPRSLRFMGEAPRVDVSRGGTSGSTEKFLRALRQTIFRSRQDDCLTTTRLRELYQTEADESIDTATLAHIVSCPHCLDEVNRTLGLPPLSERHPTDMTSKETPPRDGGGAGGSGVR